MQQQTIGRYQVLEEIASGGQGTVYRAWDPANGTVVALQVLHPHLASDLGVLERFRREAQLAAVVAIAISAGGNDLVSALITDAGMVAEAPEPTRTIQPISVVQGSVSGEPVANIPSQGTDSTSAPVVIHSTQVPMVATVAPTFTIVADLTPVPSPSPTLSPTPTMEPRLINPTNTPAPTDTPVGTTPTVPRPTPTPPPTASPQQGDRINEPPAFDPGQRHIRLISADASII